MDCENFEPDFIDFEAITAAIEASKNEDVRKLLPWFNAALRLAYFKHDHEDILIMQKATIDELTEENERLKEKLRAWGIEG